MAHQASRLHTDKRARNEKQAEKNRRKIENGEEVKAPIYATHFSQEDIDQEQRRPKKKVAVLLGYSGTGYKGMQLYVYDPFLCSLPVLCCWLGLGLNGVWYVSDGGANLG